MSPCLQSLRQEAAFPDLPDARLHKLTLSREARYFKCSRAAFLVPRGRLCAYFSSCMEMCSASSGIRLLYSSINKTAQEHRSRTTGLSYLKAPFFFFFSSCCVSFRVFLWCFNHFPYSAFGSVMNPRSTQLHRYISFFHSYVPRKLLIPFENELIALCHRNDWGTVLAGSMRSHKPVVQNRSRRLVVSPEPCCKHSRGNNSLKSPTTSSPSLTPQWLYDVDSDLKERVTGMTFHEMTPLKLDPEEGVFFAARTHTQHFRRSSNTFTRVAGDSGDSEVDRGALAADKLRGCDGVGDLYKVVPGLFPRWRPSARASGVPFP